MIDCGVVEPIFILNIDNNPLSLYDDNSLRMTKKKTKNIFKFGLYNTKPETIEELEEYVKDNKDKTLFTNQEKNSYRKLKRCIKNKESARRCRKRKVNLLDVLTKENKRLRQENDKLKWKLGIKEIKLSK